MKHKGVTLIELIVCIAILAIVINTIFAFSNYGNKTYARNYKKLNFQDEARNVLYNFKTDVLNSSEIISDKSKLAVIRPDNKGIVYILSGKKDEAGNDIGYLYYKDNNNIHKSVITQKIKTGTNDSKKYVMRRYNQLGTLTEFIKDFEAWLFGIESDDVKLSSNELSDINVEPVDRFQISAVFYKKPTTYDAVKNYTDPIYAYANDKATSNKYEITFEPCSETNKKVEYVEKSHSVVGSNVKISILSNMGTFTVKVMNIDGGEKYFEQTFSPSNNLK